MRTSRRAALVLSAALAAAGALAPAEAGKTRPQPRVLAASFSGIITPVAAEFMKSALDKAAAETFDAVVIELDTPGGLDLPMREIVKAILGSEVPVIVYVSPAGARAASAGVFITMAAHVAAMAPGTNIGAAHPVALGGGIETPDFGKDKAKNAEKGEGKAGAKGALKGSPSGESVMEAKLAHDFGAYLQAIATRRGRNAALAAEMVSRSTSIISGLAVRQNIVDLEAASLDELLKAVDGRKLADFPEPLRTAGASVERLPMSLRQRLLAAVCDPNVAMLLMSLGGAGILIELYSPGLILPGVVGAVSLVLAFYSFQTLSASYAGVLLILLGMLFLLLELKITSFGLLALSGAASVLFGSMMLFKDAGGGIAVSYPAVASSLVTLLAIFAGLLYVSKSALSRRNEIGLEDVKGETAVARGPLIPRGQVFWHGELWGAVSLEGDLPDGAEVMVESVDGLTLKVRRRTAT
ncbi:MAG: nodulation protein NfeD [Elusimicrobia bacterium]|nr:nodulation protein NfeD [Elusimicrobiota bacterium]